MKDMFSFTIKAALILLIIGLIMLIITPFSSAEWYVSLMTVILMAILVAVASFILYKNDKGGKK